MTDRDPRPIVFAIYAIGASLLALGGLILLGLLASIVAAAISAMN